MKTTNDIMKKNSTLRVLCILTVFMFNLLTTKAQNSTVTGTLTDEKNNPVAGATVAVKNKSLAVTSNNEGTFTITARVGEVLVITSVGYAELEVKLTAVTSYNLILKATTSSLGSVTVIGSRGKPRSDVNRPVPVDVISSQELESTGQVDLGQMAQFTSPSFNSAKNGINGVANYADPASLRGMSPDQSMVLVNGKRRHQ
ncbi:MAG: carboxypeptidase-like regulatory domain-containing protein [Chitinophagaceae bacterium]